jgi:hypothetical protein
MTPRLALRLLVVAHLMLMVLGVGLSFFDEHLLPKELADWKAGAALGDDLSWSEFLLFASWVVWMLVYLVACIGLLFLKRWAAVMMLILTVLGLGFVLSEPNVESGLLAAINQLNMLVMGAILAVAFASDALQESPHGA